MILHKKPKENSPSKLLIQFGAEIAKNNKGFIAEIGCGYGRNAEYLASFGSQIYCVDVNDKALKHISSLNKNFSRPLLFPIKLNLDSDPWPLEKESLEAIINIHFYTPSICNILKSLKIGGCFLLETIDDRGGNYLELPRFGSIKNYISDFFDLRFYKEKRVKNIYSDSATMKLFAIKMKRMM